MKPSTAAFYADVYRMLLTFAPLAHSRLDRIDEALIARYVQSCAATATVNRRLATLRRALKLAQEWRVITRAPKVRLLPGENAREYVVDRDTQVRYQAACPQLLQDAATLMLDTGLA